MTETSKGSASGGGAAGEVVKQQLSTDARAAMNYPLVKVCDHEDSIYLSSALMIFPQQTDMVEEMRLEAIDVITSAMEKYCMIEQATGPSRQYDVREIELNFNSFIELI